MIRISIDRLLARPLYEPQNGQPIPEPVLQPGMMVHYHSNGSLSEGIVEGVYFKNRSWKHSARYEYHISSSENLLNDSSIADFRWPEQGPKPEFVKGAEYYIDVERRGSAIKAVVQVQTSLKIGAEVILYGVDRNELYAVRRTTLEKMLKKQKTTTPDNPPTDLHKMAV